MLKLQLCSRVVPSPGRAVWFRGGGLAVAVLLLLTVLSGGCIQNPWLTPTPTPPPAPAPVLDVPLDLPALGAGASGKDSSGTSRVVVPGGKLEITSNPGGKLSVSLPVALPKDALLISFNDPVSGVVLSGGGLVMPVRDDAGRVMTNLIGTVGPLAGTGTAATGTMTRLELETTPLVGDLASFDARLGAVSVQLRAELMSFPAGADLKFKIRPPTQVEQNSFTLAARRAGNAIKSVAFVVEVTRMALTSKDMGAGTVTLSVGRAWADEMRIGNVGIAAVADDGTVQLLTTQFVRYTPDGQAVFLAQGSTAVSAFALVALEGAAPTPTPAPGFFSLRIQNNTVDSGTVQVQPAGVNGRYLQGTRVNLTALATPGHRFERWEEDALGNQPQLSLVMDSDKMVVAVFSVLDYPVNAGSIPPEGGTVDLSPYFVTYGYGTRVTATAVAAAGFRFTGWSGGVVSQSNPVTFIVDGAKNVSANFSAVRYTFSASVNQPGAGTVSPQSGSAESGATATLAATPAQGWNFSFWSGDASGSSNPLYVFMDRNKSIVANFTRARYTLSVAAQPSTGGAVSPSGGSFSFGETVSIRAITSGDYLFTGWSGDVSGSENPITVTMTRDMRVAANFAEVRYVVSVSIAPAGAGFVNPPIFDTFTRGTIVTLQASALPGYRFIAWSGDISSFDSLVTFRVSSNMRLVANFDVEITPAPTLPPTPPPSGSPIPPGPPTPTPVPPPSTGSFTLIATPASLYVSGSGPVTCRVTVVPSGGFTGSVTLSLAGAPAGVSATFNPSQTISSSTMTVRVLPNAGSGALTIQGSSGSVTATTTVSLRVE